MLYIIIIALTVVGVGLAVISNGGGAFGWIILIVGALVVFGFVGGFIGKAKEKLPKKPSSSSYSSDYSSYSSSSSSDIDSAASDIASDTKMYLKDLSDVYWEDVDWSTTSKRITITVHYTIKDNGYNYHASQRDIDNAIDAAVSKASRNCKFSVSARSVCDEIYSGM